MSRIGQPENQGEQAEAVSDACLIERAKTDPEAFGILYERYVDRIYSYVYYRTGNHADAEDLTAKTFYRAMQHIRHYQERGLPFSAWLYRIAHNLVANWHRDRSKRQVVSLDELHSLTVGEGPERAAERRERTETLLRVIRNLPPERQELLILKFVEHLSNAEIGKIMGRSEGAIKSLYHRTLLSLRELYEELEEGGLLANEQE
ncbi:MAG: sigma-70 family RNA polymerase sigma factor [Anaerolineae bacterium]|jgi:RNA polymerase sigma-70 factor (ECF subfamily)|nr:sigma-70 family RNA polymerase sigma factor [Anaerolineae bacterium]